MSSFSHRSNGEGIRIFAAKERTLPEFENSQKRGLPTRKAVNSLTLLLEPASEKAQEESVVLGNLNFDLWQSEYG